MLLKNAVEVAKRKEYDVRLLELNVKTVTNRLNNLSEETISDDNAVFEFEEKVRNSSLKDLSKWSLRILREEVYLRDIWERRPQLKNKVRWLYKRHYDSSKGCTDCKTIADNLLKGGKIERSKEYRKKSIEYRDECISLQKQIKETEDEIDSLLARAGADFRYKEYRKLLTETRRKQEEAEREIRRRASSRFDSRTKKLNRLLELSNKQLELATKRVKESWQDVYDLALEISNIPKVYWSNAKVSYQPSMKQIKIIFGEQEDSSDHGHVQIDIIDDMVVYYRMPGEKHGVQNIYMR